MKPPAVIVHHDKEDKEKLEIRAECRAAGGGEGGEGRKHVEKIELKTHDMDTVKYVERKLVEKGIQRLDRHPADGLPLKHNPKKKGHGGKYSWEGPDTEFENELLAEAAIDEKDPNYVDDDDHDQVQAAADDDDDGDVVVIGEVETPKTAPEGVARIQLHLPQV